MGGGRGTRDERMKGLQVPRLADLYVPGVGTHTRQEARARKRQQHDGQRRRTRPLMMLRLLR